MPDQLSTVPVILLDGLLASGSSVISTYVGNSYSFFVVNGNQYLRDLGVNTGFVKAVQGSLDHERQMLDFYQFIANDGAKIHDQMYSFLTSKVSIAKKPTVVHCTGYAAYAFTKQVPVKHIYWLHATLNDRVERLLHRHGLEVTPEVKQEFKEKLAQIDALWEAQLMQYLGIDMTALEKKPDSVIDTANLNTEQAFQKLATIDSFVDTYNSLASLMPDYAHEWRRWRCLVCQLILETNKIILQCPRCDNNDPDRFEDAD